MILAIKQQYKDNKDWCIRIMALVLTILCTFTLYLVGEPRPYHIAIPRGFLNSLFLNAPLWLASFKYIRIRFKYPIAFFIFISSLGIFLATPWGWALAFISLAFHWWFIFDLIKSKEDL